MVKQNILTENDAENHLKIIKKLDELKFTDILLDKLTQTDGYIGEQESLFNEILSFGRKIVEKLLISNETEQAKVFSDLTKNIHQEIDFFSEKLVMLKANKMFQRGAKAFNLEKYEMAIDEFEKAEKMYRDQILTYWNLGRLYTLEDDAKHSRLYYNNALSLTDHIDYENKTSIQQELQKEIENPSSEKIKSPIVTLYKL
jgi:tetratricopeptide (TPR) repeat protein